MFTAAAIATLVAVNLPLGLEVDFSGFPRQADRAGPFVIYLRISAADGTVTNSVPIHIMGGNTPDGVCGMLFAVAKSQGWIVSRRGRTGPVGDEKFVVYGTKAGPPVREVVVNSPYPVAGRQTPRQLGRHH